MKIKSIYIVSFRNIKNAAYTNLDSNGTTIFSGNNMKGKTNTLNAIYWCITGIDLNGSNDNSLNIPYGEKEANVSIKFDDTTEIERKAILEDGKVSQSVYVNGEKMTLKKADALIDEKLGITEIAKFDNTKIKARRLLLNPLYYRSVAQNDLKNWLISVLLNENEKEIIEKSSLSHKIKELVKDELSLADLSKVVKTNLTNIKAEIHDQELIKEFLEKKGITEYSEELENNISNDKRLLLQYDEKKIAIEEAALELNKYYQDKLNDKNLKIVLLEKCVEDDSYTDVCYPKLIEKELPFKNGSTAESIVVSVLFIRRIEHLLAINELPKLIDEGETLDNETLKSLSAAIESQLILTTVEKKQMDGIKLCKMA